MLLAPSTIPTCSIYTVGYVAMRRIAAGKEERRRRKAHNCLFFIAHNSVGGKGDRDGEPIRNETY